MEAREFFINELDEDPGNKSASSWLDKTNKQLVEVTKEEIKALYSDQNFEKALELSIFLDKLKPNDEEIIEVKELIKSDYDTQKEFDEFSKFIESKYSEMLEIFNKWQKVMSSAVVGKADVKDLRKTITDFLPDVSRLRSEIQEKNLSVNNEVFLDSQNIFFEYVNSLEKDITRVLLDNPEKVNDYQRDFERLSPDLFNDTFIRIQKGINDYINQEDAEGNRLVNIKSTLDFNRVEEELGIDIVNEDDVNNEENEVE